MRVLVACEFSGIVRDAFRARGHDAWSCDLLPTERPGPHIQADVLAVIEQDWDLIIAHPPCTYLANSGVRWLSNPERYTSMMMACEMFNRLLDADCQRVAVENPIQHGEARQRIRKYDQIIQPWQFGHNETKATCLWLKGLPKLEPSKIVEPDFGAFPSTLQVHRATGKTAQGRGSGYHARVHREPPSPDRWKNRSRTLQGIADAMAAQWG